MTTFGLLLLNCSLWGKSVSTHAEGVEVHRQKSWGLPSVTSTNSLKLWMSHLGTESSSFSQAFRWKQLWPKSWLQPLMQDLKSHCPSTLILIHWNCVRYCLLLCKLTSLGAGWLLYYASVNNIYTQNVKKIEKHCFKSKKEYIFLLQMRNFSFSLFFFFAKYLVNSSITTFEITSI